MAAGIPGVQLDGNDVVAVRYTMERALERARSGAGAMLVEAVTYRLSDHTTADDASRYRDEAEVAEARQLEPLIRLRKYLCDIGAWDDKQEEALLAECREKVDAAVEEYLSTPIQPAGAMFDYMFAELPESLKWQRELALEYEPSEGGH